MPSSRGPSQARKVWKEPRSPTLLANSESPEKPTKHRTKVKKRRKEIRGPFLRVSLWPRVPLGLGRGWPSHAA